MKYDLDIGPLKIAIETGETAVVGTITTYRIDGEEVTREDFDTIVRTVQSGAYVNALVALDDRLETLGRMLDPLDVKQLASD